MDRLIDILNFCEEYFSKYSFSKPKLEAQKLLSHVLKIDRILLYASYDKKLTSSEKEKIKALVVKMCKEGKTLKELEGVVEKKPEDTKRIREENKKVIDGAIGYLEKHGVEDSKFEGESIISHVIGISRMLLSLNLDRLIEEEEKDTIRKMLKERGIDKRPLAYIFGEEEFYGYTFKVREGVLIPRSETELLVEQCIGLMYGVEEPKILDIGTGSGAISITLGKKIEKAKVLGADISDAALDIANENIKYNEVTNVKTVKSNIFSNITYKEFDLIVSNPPYIPRKEYSGLMDEVKDHEPRIALTDDGDGYKFYKEISKTGLNHLKEGGYLAFEGGYNQGEEIRKIMIKDGYENVVLVKDYHGIERIIIGRKEVKDVD